MRRKYVIGALALTATLAALILQISSSPQPSFKGKGLSEWVRGYEGNARHADVDEAMRQMGTNSLPILLRMVGEAEWSVVAKRKVFNFGQKLHLVKSDQTPLRFSREAAG